MIRFMPKLDSTLWSRKTLQYFDSKEDLVLHIADKMTRASRFVGRPEKFYNPCDVNIEKIADYDPVMCWKNYCVVRINGTIVGYCGE